MFVIVGSNDCDSETSISDTLSIYVELLNQAKRVAVSGVFVSSILPRLAGARYMAKLDELNNGLFFSCVALLNVL